MCTHIAEEPAASVGTDERSSRMMEVVSSAETSVNFYQTTQCYVTQDDNIRSHCSKIL